MKFEKMTANKLNLLCIAGYFNNHAVRSYYNMKCNY